VRFLVATTLLVGVGCGFEHGQLGDDGDPGVDAQVLDPGTGSGSGTPQPTQRTCKFPDSALRLCLEFDDGVLTPKVLDASSAQLDPDASGLGATMRGTDPAVTMGATASISVPEKGELDISTAITIEAWVRPTQAQTATVVGNQGQYLMGIDGAGRVICSMAGAQVATYGTYDGAYPYTWHHIACTFESTLVRAYLDGDSHDCMKGSATIATGGTTGTKIANSFPGDIDGVRIYSRDLGASNELCAHAGRTSCQRQCNTGSEPDEGYGGGGGFGGGH
jgi:hypothetical protein